jgi:hypothetical protein
MGAARRAEKEDKRKMREKQRTLDIPPPEVD